MLSKRDYLIGALCLVNAYLIFNVFRNSSRENLQPSIPFKAYPDAGKAAIYLWPPSTSAAIVDDKNNRCVLVASGAQASASSAKNALKAPEISESLKGLDASSKIKMVETFTRISQADSRAAALDIALFHLCILDQNGTFNGRHKGNTNPKPSEKTGFNVIDSQSSNEILQFSKAQPILDAYKFTVEKAFSMELHSGEQSDAPQSSKK